MTFEKLQKRLLGTAATAVIAANAFANAGEGARNRAKIDINKAVVVATGDEFFLIIF